MLRKIAVFLSIVMMLNINSVFAAVGIEDYFERGWSDEYAGGAVAETYISQYSNEIKIVTDLGFMFPDAGGSFGERDNMLYSDFVQLMSRFIGSGYANADSISDTNNYVTSDYAVTTMAEYLGYGYLQKVTNKDLWSLGSQYGILKGLSLSRNGYITREQMAKLIVNCFEAERVVYDGNSYNLSETRTLLSDMDITVVKGFVSAAGLTNLYGLAEIDEDDIRIGTQVFTAGSTNATEYLGCFVKAYIYDLGGDNTVSAICFDKTRGEYSFTINADDIERVTDTCVEYYNENSDKLLKKSVSIAATVIYNGKYIGTMESVDNSYLSPDAGSITLIDSKDSGKCDVVVVTDYTIGVVENVYRNKIVLKNNIPAINTENQYDVLNVYLEGQPSELSELREWTVLSIAESLDKTICNIYATTSRFSSKLISVSNSDDGKYVFENGQEVKPDVSFFGSISVGNSYTVYLTTGGKIATVGTTSEALKRNYGYLRACVAEESNFKENARFRIFDLAKNEWLTLEATEDIIFYDGASTPDTGAFEIVVEKSKVSPAVVAKQLEGKPQLVVYEADAYGKLKSITTAYDSSASGIVDDDVFTYNDTYDSTMAGRFPFTAGNFVFGYYHMGKNVYQLIVPTDRSDEDKYSVSLLNNYDGKIYAPFDIYDADSTRKLNGVVVRYTDDSSAKVHESCKLIVRDVQHSLTSKGEEIIEITSVQGKIFYIEKGETNIFIPSSLLEPNAGPYTLKSADEIQVGDVLTYDVDSRNYLTAVRKDLSLNDLKDKQYFTYVSEFDGPPATMYDYGVVVKNPTGETHLTVISEGDGSDYKLLKPRRVSTVYTYSRQKQKFYEGSQSKDAIAPGDVVFLNSAFYYSNSLAIIIE